jgi:hypothetical protein
MLSVCTFFYTSFWTNWPTFTNFIRTWNDRRTSERRNSEFLVISNEKMAAGWSRELLATLAPRGIAKGSDICVAIDLRKACNFRSAMFCRMQIKNVAAVREPSLTFGLIVLTHESLELRVRGAVNLSAHYSCRIVATWLLATNLILPYTEFVLK